MKTNRFIILACSVSVISSVLYFNYGALSIIDFSAGENELINNETTPFKVNITSGNKIAAVIPVGIGVRGDADESGNVSLYDAIEISYKQTQGGLSGFSGLRHVRYRPERSG